MVGLNERTIHSSSKVLCGWRCTSPFLITSSPILFPLSHSIFPFPPLLLPTPVHLIRGEKHANDDFISQKLIFQSFIQSHITNHPLMWTRNYLLKHKSQKVHHELQTRSMASVKDKQCNTEFEKACYGMTCKFSNPAVPPKLGFFLIITQNIHLD